MGWQPICLVYGIWVYPPLEVATEEAYLEEVDMYVTHRHNTVAHFIMTRPIVDLCLAAERRSGARVSQRWWEQDNLDLEGMWVASGAAVMEEEEDGDGKY